MNYPVWDVPFLGAGLVVAIIAIIHILIAHLAIGGGAFLFVAEWWSDRQPDGQRIRDWLHKFATFFLVYTTVFGAMTGVGIWFSIQLASPEGASLLIHQFVFAWAAEWVTFLGELTVLYLYYYGWKTNSRKMQTFLAGAYFVIAWFSLFIINGILTFMLTPGEWTLANTDIAAGFFNPAYLPSLLFRTVVMVLIAGLAGMLVASKIEDGAFKERIVLFSAKFILPAAIFAPVFFIWYWTTVPAATQELVEQGMTGVGGGRMEAISRYLWLAVASGALIVVGTFVAVWRPRAVSTPAAIGLLVLAQGGVMGGEFFREMARKPFVVYGVMYSNAVWKHLADAGEYDHPFLESTRWDPEVEPLSLEHGEWVFRLQCASCHTRHGYRALDSRTESWTGVSGFNWLPSMDAQGVMPPFQGTAEDRAALSAYLLSLHGEGVSAAEILQEAGEEVQR